MKFVTGTQLTTDLRLSSEDKLDLTILHYNQEAPAAEFGSCSLDAGRGVAKDVGFEV